MGPFKVVSTVLPSYLKEFIKTDLEITLICSQVIRSPTQSSEGEPVTVNDTINSTINRSQLDLTGSPLKVELNNEDDFDLTICNEKPPNWSIAEAGYVPLCLRDARSFLNKNLIKNYPLEFIMKPLFCLCDGSDKQHTVLIGKSGGVCQTTYRVDILGCFPFDHEVTTTKFLEEQHLKSVHRKAAIETFVCNTYYIYGFDLKHYSRWESVEDNGSVSVQLSLTNGQLSDVNVNLQIIAGHRLSPVDFLWSQLDFLESLMNGLTNIADDELHTMEICADPLSITDILEEIRNSLNAIIYEKEDDKKLDLTNLRHKSILDLLWEVLKRCGDLSDLREAFHMLFEELIEIQTKIQVPQDSNCLIVSILNGILSGIVAVPTLSFSQSLELLLELGLEHLKNDYLAIVSHFCDNSHEAFTKKWLAACPIDPETSNQAIKRKTRMTMLPKSANINMANYKLKHKYLTQMHVLIEFLFFSNEHCRILDESFEDISMNLYDYFMLNNDCVKQFSELKTNRLSEYSFAFNAISQHLFDNKIPITRHVEMKSSLVSAEIKTSFHYSSKPIFPETVFNDYDVPVKTDSPVYYVTKFLQLTEKAYST